MPSSRGSAPTHGSNPRLFHPLHWQVGSLPLAPLGRPFIMCILPQLKNLCKDILKIPGGEKKITHNGELC